MAVSIVPAMLNALYTLSTAALPSTLVLYGYGVTDDANPNLLMVGVDDPDSTSPAATSDAQQVMATAGPTRSRTETGSITCAALSWSGDALDQATTVAAAYSTFEAVASFLRSDPTAGVSSGYQLVVAQIESHRLSTLQYEDGCEALLVFTIAFEARI